MAHLRYVERMITEEQVQSEVQWLRNRRLRFARMIETAEGALVVVRVMWPHRALVARGYRPAERRRATVGDGADSADVPLSKSAKRRLAEQHRLRAQDARELAKAKPALKRAIDEWTKLSPSGRIARIGGRAIRAPRLASPRVRDWTYYRLWCAYCARYGSPNYFVSGSVGDAFLCLLCLEKARDAGFRHGKADAMDKAYERHRKV